MNNKELTKIDSKVIEDLQKRIDDYFTELKKKHNLDKIKPNFGIKYSSPHITRLIKIFKN